MEQEQPEGKHMQKEAPPTAPEKQEVRNSPAPMPKGSLISLVGQDDGASLYKGRSRFGKKEKHGENIPTLKGEHSETTQ